ncbi:MAG: zinc ribbon domain-containing protein [Candidatus Lokiarchaeota archaeon]
MYCPNCGAELESPNQKFCQECGTQILGVAEPSSSKPEMDISQYSKPPSTATTIQPPPQPTPVPATQKAIRYDIKMEYSKKALGFGLVSFLIAIGSLFVIPALVIIPLLNPYYYNYGTTIIFLPIVFGLHGLGLLFGILGTVFGSKAKEYDSDNGMQKAGLVFGIIGIIINALALLSL